MRIGVISDTHLAGEKKPGGWRSLMGRGPATLEELILRLETVFGPARGGVEMVVHAGDVTSQTVLDKLGKLGPVEAVRGNMDGANMGSLPEKKVLEVGGRRVGVIHGWGSPKGIQQRIRGSFQGVDVIIYGHTHEPFNEVVDGVLFFNPGSPTDSFFAPYKSVGVLEISQEIKGEIIRL